MAGLLQHRAGTGPPLVLLHGLGGSWRTWGPVLPALEAEHDVLALDLPGFGAAPPLPRRRPPTVGALASAVADELAELGIRAPHVVGNSLGGRVAIELARRGLARTLVAISPSGLEVPAERAWIFWADQGLRLRAKLGHRLGAVATASAAARVMTLTGPHARPWRVPPEEGAHQLEVLARSPSYQSALLWAGMLDVPWRVREVRCPARIVVGTADVLLGALTGPRYAAAIPGADLVVLPAAGHMPMWDAPVPVARAILGVTTVAA